MSDDPWGTVTGPTAERERGDAEQRALVPRDQYDRYLMKHEDGTKPAANKGFTRVSTTKSALSNTIGIQKWSGRRIVDGATKNDAWLAEAMRVGGMPDGKDKEQALGRLADKAFQLGGGKDRSGRGTDFHQLTEELNRGEAPEIGAHEQDIDAYRQMLSDNDIQIMPDMLERQVLCPFNQAGTFDNMVRMWNPLTEEYEVLIADLKTGRSLDLGWLEILIQLWNYSNAHALWTTTAVVYSKDDPTKVVDIEGFYEPMPRELRTDKALIFHVPLDGTATLYVLDLSGIERWVRAAVEAKRANAEAKLKVTKVASVQPPAFVAPDWQQDVSNSRDAEDRAGGRRAPELSQADPIAAAGYPALSRGIAEQAAATAQMPAGVIACGPEEPTVGDIAVVQEFAEHLRQKTPQMAEGERVAAERLAAAAGKAVESFSTLTPGQQSAAVAVVAEHDPVTGRKKRTCGHCRKPGHTQKNCPENPASAKYVPPEPTVILNQDTDPYQGPNDGEPASMVIEHAELQSITPDGQPAMVISPEGPPAGLYVSGPEDMPWCPGPTTPGHGEWTSTHPDAPGVWVCVADGKPSKLVWLQREATATAARELAEATSGPAAPVVDPGAQVLQDIANATTSQQVLSIRESAIKAYHWDVTRHEVPARTRYEDLALQGL